MAAVMDYYYGSTETMEVGEGLGTTCDLDAEFERKFEEWLKVSDAVNISWLSVMILQCINAKASCVLSLPFSSPKRLSKTTVKIKKTKKTTHS